MIEEAVAAGELQPGQTVVLLSPSALMLTVVLLCPSALMLALSLTFNLSSLLI